MNVKVEKDTKITLSDEERKTLRNTVSLLDELCRQLEDSCWQCPLRSMCNRLGVPSDLVTEIIKAFDKS